MAGKELIFAAIDVGRMLEALCDGAPRRGGRRKAKQAQSAGQRI
jgi:hypothetical protein